MENFNLKDLLKKCFGKDKDDKYHAAGMLIIYGIFIAILVIFIRTSPSNTNNEVKKENSNNNANSNSQIKLDENGKSSSGSNDNDKKTTTAEKFDVNYSYIFTINTNGVKEIFTGKKLDEKEIFTYINSKGSIDYAKLSDNYLLKENGEYHIVDMPSVSLMYTDMDKISSLSENGQLIRNDNIYTFTVKTNDVVKSFNPDSKILVSDELTDTIIITTENEMIKTINMSLNNYYSVLYGSGTLDVKVELNNIGTTENFDVTISN